MSAGNVPGISPLVGSYNSWVAGRQIGPSLPRLFNDFQAGAFGPMTPLTPMAIDVPEESGRPSPRRRQYPVGWNLPVGQPGSEGGSGKLAPFDVLYKYADAYSVGRACINIRRDEMAGLSWDIGPTADAQANTKGDKGAAKDQRERAATIVNWFKRIDSNYYGFQNWFTAALEQQIVIDALSLYLAPTRVEGKGLFGSDLSELQLLDGSTIRPLYDMHGARPGGGRPAYQQYLYGVPRSEYTAIMSGEDLDEMAADLKDAGIDDDVEPLHEYRGDQLLYLPRLPRISSPYGFGPVEQSLIPLTLGMMRQNYLIDYYQEGCHDDKTEVLTDDGWKTFADLAGSERLATRSQGGYFEWQAPTKIHQYPSSGKMLHFSGRSVDAMVTPGHRMYVASRDRNTTHHGSWSDYEFRLASELAADPNGVISNFPTTQRWVGTEPGRKVIPAIEVDRRHPAVEKAAEIIRALVPCRANVALQACVAGGVSTRAGYSAKVAMGIKSTRTKWSDPHYWGLPERNFVPAEGGHMPSRGWNIGMKEWAEFLGLYIAEGWTRAPFEVFVSQSPKSARLDEVKRILAATPFKWSYDEDKCQFSTTSKTLVLELAKCGKYAENKRIPAEMKELTTPYIEATLHGFWVGDGTIIKSSGQRSFATTSPTLADDIQELLIKCGRMASRRKQGANRLGKRPYYTLMESSLEKRVLPKPKWVDYSGDVWCAEVPNKTLFTRRNGVVTLSGNTIPGTFVIAGDQYVTPAQQRQLQDTLNAIAGDTAWKHRIIVLPPGSKSDPQKNMDGQFQLDQVIAEQVAMVMHIQPHEIGITPGGRSGGLGGKGVAEQQQASVSEQRTEPDRKWWKESCFDLAIQRVFGQGDLEWKWVDFENEKDAAEEATSAQTRIFSGQSTIDQELIDMGKDGFGLPLTQVPLLVLGSVIYSLDPSVPSPVPPAAPAAPGGPGGPGDPASAALTQALQPEPGKNPAKPKNDPASALLSDKKGDRKKGRKELASRFADGLKDTSKHPPIQTPAVPGVASKPAAPTTATQTGVASQSGAVPTKVPKKVKKAVEPDWIPETVADLMKKKGDLSQGEFIQVVLADLSHQYPPKLTTWVSRLDWNYDDAVKVKNMTGQPSTGVDPKIITAIGLSMQAGAPVDPLVLVEFPDSLMVANGNKRYLAAQEQGVKKLAAYIGTVADTDADEVQKAIKEMQDPKYQPSTKGPDIATQKAALAEIGVLNRFLKKGGDIAKFKPAALNETQMRLLSDDLATMDQTAALDAARERVGKNFSVSAPLATSIAPFDLDGQQPEGRRCPKCDGPLTKFELGPNCTNCQVESIAPVDKVAPTDLLLMVEVELSKRGALTDNHSGGTLTKGNDNHDERGRFATADGGASGDPLVQSRTDFHNALEKALPPDHPRTLYVNHYTTEEMKGMTPILRNGDRTGVLIHDHGDGRIEATALFNTSDVRGAGKAILQDAITNHGVNYVECLGMGLADVYSSLGFVDTSVTPFDPQQAPTGWNTDTMELRK